MSSGVDASRTGLSRRETYGTPMPATSYPFMGRSGDPFMPPFGDPYMGYFMGALSTGPSRLYS